MVIDGVLVDVLLISLLGGFAAKTFSSFVSTASLLDKWRDRVCGFLRNSDGEARIVDDDKHEGVICEWASCPFCLSGWSAMFLAGSMLILTGTPYIWGLVAWPAAWCVAMALPE